MNNAVSNSDWLDLCHAHIIIKWIVFVNVLSGGNCVDMIRPLPLINLWHEVSIVNLVVQNVSSGLFSLAQDLAECFLFRVTQEVMLIDQVSVKFCLCIKIKYAIIIIIANMSIE